MATRDRERPSLALVMTEDITEPCRAETELHDSHNLLEQQLRESQARFQAIFYGAPVGISLVDREGRYVSVNPIRQEMLGYSEAELIGKRYQDLTYAEDLEDDERVNAQAREQGLDRFQIEKRFVRKDGTVRWARITTSIVRDEVGEIQYSISIAEDITEQRNLERHKDEFLSAAAHDLRTPLTTVKGRVQLLHRLLNADVDLDRERILDNLARIDANVGRMVTLINELLDVANIELGRAVNLDMRPVDLVQLAETVVSEHGQATDRHRVVMEARVPELMGSWDAARLERVLGNLVSNAIKYSPSGGDICIVLTRERVLDRDWAVLAVQDHGVGIPASDLPYIFERFHRGGNVTGKIPGTGIGLAAVRQIVEQHGGSITVESQEGERTVFTVRLPL